MAVVSSVKIQRLSAALGDAAGGVSFHDLAQIGGNPARLIPVWQQFVSGSGTPGRRCRGNAQPAVPRGTEAELAECWQHETLLNLAFDTSDFWLMCSYDRSSLEPSVVEDARSHHPFFVEDDHSTVNEQYTDGASPALAALSARLASPPPEAESLVFGAGNLGEVRGLVAARAAVLGTISPPEELVIAVNEVATNSIRHGGGSGVVLVWNEPGSLVCEIRDSGEITDPLVGRRRPSPDSAGGRGLWIANQLCDLVQIRSGAGGSVVRLHSRTVPRAASQVSQDPTPPTTDRGPAPWRRAGVSDSGRATGRPASG